ncbi:MAG: hypothetical protein GC182_08575 [Rhodopseudomonas sp.]|nr:hypothetical protein [Rhodopseudomonas sp.]
MGTNLATGLAAVDAAAGAVSKADHDKALADVTASADQLLAEGVAKAKADGVKEGATAERARVKGILGSEQAKGRDGLAQHLAFETDLPVEQAVAMLGAAPAAAPAKPGSRLDAAMAGAQPNVDANDKPADPVDGLAAALDREIAKIAPRNAA